MKLDQLLKVIKVLPDGKTILPVEIIIDKLDRDIVITIRMKLLLDKTKNV